MCRLVTSETSPSYLLIANPETAGVTVLVTSTLSILSIGVILMLLDLPLGLVSLGMA